MDLEDDLDEIVEISDAAEGEEETDEIDPSVEASDAAIVEEVALEADEQDQIPKLTRAEVNLGRFAVTKVSEEYHHTHQANMTQSSFEMLRNESSTAQPSVLTWRQCV
jgi:hypothetical protein